MNLPVCPVSEQDGDMVHCPQCGSETGLKYPRNLPEYCEDCGWPDEDFSSDEHYVQSKIDEHNEINRASEARGIELIDDNPLIFHPTKQESE